MTDEPRSLGEALAAGDQEREESMVEKRPPDPEGPVAEEAESFLGEGATEKAGTLSDVRSFLGEGDELRESDARRRSRFPAGEDEPAEEPPTVEPEGHDPHREQSEAPQFPGAAPSMSDLREALVTLVATAPPTEDLGPMVEFGGRKVPAAYVKLWQQGWLR